MSHGGSRQRAQAHVAAHARRGVRRLAPSVPSTDDHDVEMLHGVVVPPLNERAQPTRAWFRGPHTCCRPPQRSPSLADAEPLEDMLQYVLRRSFAGYLLQRHPCILQIRQDELFGHGFGRSVRRPL